jgi:hypothetical protein
MDEKKRNIESAKRNRAFGSGALLVAILGFFFFYPLLWLWILLGAAGLLTLLTSLAKLHDERKGLGWAESKRREVRSELSEKRAELDAAMEP